MTPLPMKTVKLPPAKIPVIADADVVVLGGGNAGFVAAVAASRAGAKTILIERYGYLAGELSGTYATTPSSFGDSDNKQIIGGIGWEFVEQMEKAGYAKVNRDVWLVQILPEVSKEIALNMVIDAGVELFLHSWASEALVDQGIIQGIAIQNKQGRQAILGKCFVDASGDGDLAAWAGAPFEQLDSDGLWQTTVDLTIANIDYSKVLDWGKTHEDRVVWMGGDANDNKPGLGSVISMIILNPDLSQDSSKDSYVGPVPTIKLMPFHSVGRVQGSVEINPLDVRSLTWAEIEARKRGMRHLEYLKRTVPGFEDAFVVNESHLGIRESRRITGEYVLTLQDLISNARFKDVVALNCRALDRHMKGEVFQFDLLNGNHDIPLRALIPKDVKNLFIAGRCISCDHESHASLRGAATCLATGHAAGVAAAVVDQTGSISDPQVISRVQEVLTRQGAILRTE